MAEFLVKVKPEYLVANRPAVASTARSVKASDDEPRAPISLDNHKDGEILSSTIVAIEGEGGHLKRDSHAGGRNKKRPRDNRVAKEDRLCLSTNKGQVCPWVRISDNYLELYVGLNRRHYCS